MISSNYDATTIARMTTQNDRVVQKHLDIVIAM